MAEQLLYGDARDVGSQQIVGEGAPVRSTCGTGVPWGMIVRGGAHTPACVHNKGTWQDTHSYR
jgi:hypothetical protein